MARTQNGIPVAYLDGPGGSQIVDTAITAMTRYLTAGIANRYGAFATSQETDRLVLEATAGAAALLGARPEEVAFGQNMTSLAYALASALGPTWRPGDNVVVTELDHRANVDPWVRAAQLAGAEVRWLPVDTAAADPGPVPSRRAHHDRTRLVAIGRASNAVGTITDIAPVAEIAHARGSLVAVDAVHAVPHLPTDRDSPRRRRPVLLGVQVLRAPPRYRRHPRRPVRPARPGPTRAVARDRTGQARDGHPEPRRPGRPRWGGGLHRVARVRSRPAGPTGLGHGPHPGPRGPPGDRLPPVCFAGIAGAAALHAGRRRGATPTFAFTLAGLSPDSVARHLARDGLFVGDGALYASTLDQRLGTAPGGGWVRVGLAPYTTTDELARCLVTLRRLAGSR